MSAVSDREPLYRSRSAPVFAVACTWCGLFASPTGAVSCRGAGAGTVCPGVGVAVAAGAESRQPCISIPPNSPTNIAAPAISGIQMRSRSLFHSCKSVSTVFARLSRECVRRLRTSGKHHAPLTHGFAHYAQDAQPRGDGSRCLSFLLPKCNKRAYMAIANLLGAIELETE